MPAAPSSAEPACEAAPAALLIGASGGIGGALLQRWLSSERYQHVFASTRQAGQLAAQPGLSPLMLDLTDDASIADFSACLGDQLQARALKLSSIVIASGLLHQHDIQPERSLAALEADAFEQMLRVNALGPLRLLQQLEELLPRRAACGVLLLSARVGSIADNRLGGWYSYRCSKAALNQGIRTLAVEWRRTRPACVLTLYHPGTVDTALSAPFSSRVPADKLFSPQQAAAYLDQVLLTRSAPDSHGYVDWQGKEIPF